MKIRYIKHWNPFIYAIFYSKTKTLYRNIDFIGQTELIVFVK